MKKEASENKILENAFFYTLSSIITLVLSFISVSLLTFLLSTDEYGIVDLFTSTVSMFTIVLSVSISASISRYYYENSVNYREFIKSICLFILIFNGVLTPFFIVFSSYFSDFLNIDKALYYLIIIGSYINIFLEFYERHLVASQNSKRHMFFKVIPSLLNTVISILLILSLRNLNGGYIRVLVIIAVNFLFLLYIVYKARGLLKERIKSNNIKMALLFSLPLVLHSLSNYVLTYFDKLVINQHGNLSNTGIYSLATRVGEVLLLVVNSVNYSWAPVFYQNNGDYRCVEGVLKKYMQLIVLLALGIIYYVENFAKIIISSNYYEALSIIPILCLGYIMVFLYQIYVNYAIYRKKTLNITVNTIMAAVLNVELNYIFIPKYGYQAASYTTLVSYFVLFLLHYINSKYILKGEVYRLSNMKNEFIFLVIGLIIYYLTREFCPNLIILIIIRTVYIVFLMIKYDIINIVKSFLFSRKKEV